MARIVRKVSNKSVKGQKRTLNKKYVIIGSIIAAIAVIGLVVGLIVGLNQNNSTTTTEAYSYNFSKATTSEVNDSKEITFEKITYAGISNYINPNYVDPITGDSLHKELVFVFAYSSSAFVPEEGKDNYSSLDADIVRFLADLQYTIENSQVEAKLYIVDTDKASSSGILTDSRFGNDENNTAKEMFCLIENGEYKKFSDEENSKLVSTTSKSTMKSTCIKNAITYIRSK